MEREQFWQNVQRDSPSECWEWAGSRLPEGYGRLGKEIASRVSYRIHFGPIPDGIWVLHRCDNPPCVNPGHLFLGDHAANMRDAARKGRLRGTFQPKVECINGHPLSGDNVRITPSSGRKNCRACDRDRRRRYYAAMREGE
jgi:hypothetical protein